MAEQDSSSGRGIASRRFSAIAPFATPAEFPLVSAQFKGRRVLLARTLAQQAGRSQSTIYKWRRLWRDGGLAALEPRKRSDRNQPRRLNPAGAEFLLRIMLSCPQTGCLRPTAASVYRAYVMEAAWRSANVGERLGEFAIRKYGPWADSAGRLSPDAVLPNITYETGRYWLRKLPELARFLSNPQRRAPQGAAREGYLAMPLQAVKPSKANEDSAPGRNTGDVFGARQK
jgi:hypothetical protein